MNLLIRAATMDGAPHDILIRGGRIEALEPSERQLDAPAIDRVIDGAGLHAFPSLANAHTHVAMVLFRGYGDDMPLMEWLRTRIWPAEKMLTAEDVYQGARLGIIEMIRGGCTFFNEMYWYRDAIVRAAEELGIRALVGQTLIGVGEPDMVEGQKAELVRLAETRPPPGTSLVELSAAPHSIYTVSPDDLRWVGDFAREHELLVHIHLSETQGEVDDCMRLHGCRPAQLLDRLGLVGPNLIAAHGQFLDDDELRLLGDAGATLVNNPAANLKLATGGIFPYRAARAAGNRVCLGTDGAASNNNLDLIAEMKLAALLQKHRERDATVLPAHEALEMATVAAAEAFHLGSGRIEPGAPADLMLVDFSGPSTQPLHDPISQLVYAAGAYNVHTTICAGRVLMHKRVIEVCDEREVIEAASGAVRRLLERVANA